ncbi:hypothetical protein LNP74_29925 [Klebsiella pneumoniae subsp. pneumoniae]|nr:hypothetical protein [Klebsiella pneumoniae subsp. pneumoniae]
MSGEPTKQSGAAVLRDGVYLLPDVRQGYDTFPQHLPGDPRGRGPGMFSRLRRRKKRRSGRYSIVVNSTTRCCRICRRCRGRYPTTNWRLSSKQLRKIQRDYRRIEAIDFFQGPPRGKPLSDWPLSSRSLISGYRRTSRSRWRAN